ncbi:MAG TPA: VCBS repeat-containing protein, partial [Thermoanaerobaculia bacterium]|nr:VCBS repeat-containing protein [Thermoanaerobaculia bacterium]
PPSVGDIDGDGEPEIVHGTGTYWPNRQERIYAWNCDGSAVSGWPVTIQGQSMFSPALANLDGDPALEVVVAADNTRSSSTYHLYRFEGNGSQTFSAVPKDFFGVSFGIGHPVIADVLGDATPEILTPTNGSVAVFSATGTLLTDDGSHPGGSTYAFYTETTLSGVAVTDLNGDGKLEVLAISATPFPDATSTKINVWNPVNRTSAAPPWGFFRQDAARSGVAPGTGSCASACTLSSAATDFYTVTPCRVVNTRTTHTPALGNGQARTFTIAGSCGIPATATAISVNVTVTQPTHTGHVRFGPGGCTQLPTSAINFGPGQTRANNAILPLANNGDGTLTAIAAVLGSGSVHLLIDVNGYFQEP